MKRFVFSILVATGFISSTATADPNWPDAFRAAVTPTDTSTTYSYEQVSRDKDETLLTHFAYDGRKPDGVRASIVSLSEDAEEYREEILTSLNEDDGDIWCDDFADAVKSDVKLTSEDATSLTYTFTPTDPDADDMQRKVVEKTVATVKVSKETGFVTEIRYKLEKPYKPVFVAKVSEMEVSGVCDVSAIGRPYIKRTEFKIDLSFMGNRQQDHSIETVEKLVFY